MIEHELVRIAINNSFKIFRQNSHSSTHQEESSFWETFAIWDTKGQTHFNIATIIEFYYRFLYTVPNEIVTIDF